MLQHVMNARDLIFAGTVAIALATASDREPAPTSPPQNYATSADQVAVTESDDAPELDHAANW